MTDLIGWFQYQIAQLSSLPGLILATGSAPNGWRSA